MTTAVRSDAAFQLRIKTTNQPGAPVIVIRAYDHNARMQDTHNRVDIEVRHDGEVIFPLGQLYVGIPKSGGHSTDGTYAKEAVLSCVAMKPGDTDAEYFIGYTIAQLDWAREHSDALSMEREHRYCDEDGNPRR
jgi:hypothetical protein